MSKQVENYLIALKKLLEIFDNSVHNVSRELKISHTTLYSYLDGKEISRKSGETILAKLASLENSNNIEKKSNFSANNNPNNLIKNTFDSESLLASLIIKDLSSIYSDSRYSIKRESTFGNFMPDIYVTEKINGKEHVIDCYEILGRRAELSHIGSILNICDVLLNNHTDTDLKKLSLRIIAPEFNKNFENVIEMLKKQSSFKNIQLVRIDEIISLKMRF